LRNESLTPRTFNFEERILRSIQSDLERIHTISDPIIQPHHDIKVVNNSINIMDLYNSDRLDLLNNVAWSSANAPTQMELAMQNSANMIASNPQVMDLITLF
jgi:hypothetical protein